MRKDDLPILFVADALGGKSGLQRDEKHGLHSAMD